MNEHIKFIKNKNNQNKAASKNFYIIISYETEAKEQKNNFNEEIIINSLNDKFFKIKETLSRCGNTIYAINTKEEVEEILNSFININDI